MNDQKDKDARSAQLRDRLANRTFDPIPPSQRPEYRRIAHGGGTAMLTIVPPSWVDPPLQRPVTKDGTALMDITPIRPVPLPDRPDPAMVNAWFRENFAKHWGMADGFGAEFIALEGDLLRFRYVVDPRFKGHAFVTCLHIARCHGIAIPALAAATRFKALEFRATDILGFKGWSAPDAATFEALSERSRIAWATLPTKPSATHFGKLRLPATKAVPPAPPEDPGRSKEGSTKGNRPTVNWKERNEEMAQIFRELGFEFKFSEDRVGQGFIMHPGMRPGPAKPATTTPPKVEPPAAPQEEPAAGFNVLTGRHMLHRFLQVMGRLFG